jgi:hypothetical protein
MVLVLKLVDLRRAVSYLRALQTASARLVRRRNSTSTDPESGCGASQGESRRTKIAGLITLAGFSLTMLLTGMLERGAQLFIFLKRDHGALLQVTGRPRNALQFVQQRHESLLDGRLLQLVLRAQTLQCRFYAL